jgi:hypothetical protein
LLEVAVTLIPDGGDVAKDRMVGVQPPGTTLRVEGVVLIVPLRITLADATELELKMGLGTNSLVTTVYS